MKKKYLFWSLVIIWMIVMFSLSSDDREASSYKSKQVTALVQQAASMVPENIRLAYSLRNITEGIVRKLGHVMEYFTLTMLVIIAAAACGSSRRRALWNAVIIPILFAISDELHQFFTPGRGPQISDVVIDSLGVLIAIAIALVLSVIISIYKNFQGGEI